MPNNSGRAVTVLERIATQASRLEAIAEIVGGFLGRGSDLYQRLDQEVHVSKSIYAQVQDEATSKVEAAMPKNYDNGSDGTGGAKAEPDVPEEVQAIINGLMSALKEQGIEATIIPVPMPRGPSLNIADILKKL